MRDDRRTLKAAALGYDRGRDRAPRLLARGGGDVATKQTRDAALAAHAASLGIPYASLVNPTALWSGSGRVGALTGTGNSDIMMGSDNAHPTQAGHDMIAQAWAAGIVSQRAAA